jgi:diadenosine tetraphosphate (Ap4A) HIT family hydrolase
VVRRARSRCLGPGESVRSVVSRECELCRPDLGPVVHEAEYWRTIVNRNQDTLGKLFVALRRHEEEVACLTAGEWADLRGEVRWATERLRVAFEPDHFTYSFLMNADAHVHLHLIPRYVGTREVGGIVFSDPAYPDDYGQPRAPSDVIPEDVVRAVAVMVSE